MLLPIDFLNIPREIQISIISYFNQEIISIFPQVSKYFKQLTEDPSLWNILSNKTVIPLLPLTYQSISLKYINQIVLDHLLPEKKIKILNPCSFIQHKILLRIFENELRNYRLDDSNSLNNENQLIKFRKCLYKHDIVLTHHFYQIHPSKPLKLFSVENSCHISSVLQVLLCIPSIRQQLQQPIHIFNLEDVKEQQKIQFQQEIVQFINQTGKIFQKSYINSLLKCPSVNRLRQILFNMNLSSYYKKEDIAKKYPAIIFMQILIQEFLPICQFQLNKHHQVWSKDQLIEETIEEDQTIYSHLFIPLNDKKETLSKKIESLFGETTIEYDIQYNMKVNLPGLQESHIGQKEETSLKMNKSWPTIRALPPVLVLHFPRLDLAGINPAQNHQSVFLPETGIIDLFPYYYHEDKTALSCLENQYRIKSFIVYRGDANWGYHSAYVEIEGKYYQCDDSIENFYQEITKEEFLCRSDAYILILEKVINS